ncbi:MAG: GGDEF domain-containing protein [Pseudomonadota bacterium]|nr:GGDEF domain-containing protein [Pseudomonadota bacterium]
MKQIPENDAPRLQTKRLHWVLELLRNDYERPGDFRFFVTSQHVLLLGLILHLCFFPIFWTLAAWELATFNLVSIGAFFVALVLNKRRHETPALIIAVVEVTTHAILAVTLMGWESGFFYYILVPSPVVLLSPRWHLVARLSVPSLSAVVLVALHQFSATMTPKYELAEATTRLLYEFNLVSTVFALTYISFFYQRGAWDADEKVSALTTELQRLARTDPLTGLLNRRAITELMTEEVHRYDRYRHPFVIVLADIDNFKRVNDRYGHKTGDAILKHVSQMIGTHARKSDQISRWGGEEFLMMLPNTNLHCAYQSIERLRKKLETEQLALSASPLTVTMTFGLCEYNPSEGLDRCIAAADERLYKGKRQGKNQVVPVPEPQADHTCSPTAT